MIKNNTESFIKQIITDNVLPGIKAEAVLIGQEWCLKFVKPATDYISNFCAKYGTSGHWTKANDFIMANLATQPYNPRVRF